VRPKKKGSPQRKSGTLDVPDEGNPGISDPRVPKTATLALILLGLAIVKDTSTLALFPPKMVALRLFGVEGQYKDDIPAEVHNVRPDVAELRKVYMLVPLSTNPVYFVPPTGKVVPILP
jgi:hypothetical protein